MTAQSNDSTRDDLQSPPKTVGIVGGGQLGRMLVTASMPLGLDVRILQSKHDGPGDAAAQVFTGGWEDTEVIKAFAAGCDVITLEHEWADLDALAAVVEPGTQLWPSRTTMNNIRNKVDQKRHAEAGGIALGPYAECNSADELRAFGDEHGYPFMLKRPTHSYDGFGNRKVDSADEVADAYEALNADGQVLAEAWVPFKRELAVMVARSSTGESVTYPVCVTIQEKNQCVAVEAPAPVPDELQNAAREAARHIVDHFDCVGVVGVELFESEDGRVLFNELAPRPHNSGHYTIDACVTSQFENHLRAVLGYPLGSTDLLAPAAVMVNVVGDRHGDASAATLPDALSVQGAAVHVYGKRLVRPGRKMGHVTATGASLEEARERAYEAARRLRF